MNEKSEDLVENEPGAVGQSQVERLSERVRRIVVGLKLSNDVDQNALLDGYLRVDGSDEAIYFLKAQALSFL